MVCDVVVVVVVVFVVVVVAVALDFCAALVVVFLEALVDPVGIFLGVLFFVRVTLPLLVPFALLRLLLLVLVLWFVLEVSGVAGVASPPET